MNTFKGTKNVNLASRWNPNHSIIKGLIKNKMASSSTAIYIKCINYKFSTIGQA
jgi:hypothetical protein